MTDSQAADASRESRRRERAGEAAENLRSLSHAYPVDSPEWAALRRAEGLVRSVLPQERLVTDGVTTSRVAAAPDADGAHRPWAWAIVHDDGTGGVGNEASRSIFNVLAADLAAEYAEKTPGAALHALWLDPRPWSGGARSGPLDLLERLVFLHRQRPACVADALRAAGEHEHLHAVNAACRAVSASLGRPE